MIIDRGRRARVVWALLVLACVACTAHAWAAPTLDRRAFYRGLSKRLGRERADYPHLSDEEFANFRAVETTGMGKGALYRSSSPIKPWGGRHAIADRAARAVGIRTFVDLADTEQGMRACKGYEGSWYATRTNIALGLDTRYASATFRASLAKGLRAMAASDAPFLVHCDLGKDRAGFVCAILECLMGAGADEVVADYMLSFRNYFGIEPGTAEHELVADNEIRPFLAAAFGVASIDGVDLAAHAQRYLLDIGVPSEDIERLCRKLGRDGPMHGGG